VSTDKQGITGLGMDAQGEAVSRYVQNRGQIVAEFIEVESGKKHTNRPQLLAALAECRNRRAVLVMARLDRLARTVAFIANLMNSDVEFVAVDMPHANRLTIHILAAVAEHEREMISQRTKAALAAAKARGKKLGNPNYHEALARARAALGYKPPAPEVLNLMVGWLREGNTLRKVAAHLNSLSIRTPQCAIWYAASVRAALMRNRPEAYTSDLSGVGSPGIPSVFASNAGQEAKTEGAYMPSDTKEAERMLDLFMSVGATRFNVTFLDLLGRKTHYFPLRTPPSMRYNLSSWNRPKAGTDQPDAKA
jgi:DNA invertase Pin-like site-specific DNA recombinase